METVLHKVVDGLKTQPVLLAVFGLCFLVILYAFNLAQSSTIGEQERVYVLLGCAVAIIGILCLAALIIIRFTPIAVKHVSSDTSVMGELIPQLVQVSENLRKAETLIPKDAFKEISYEIDALHRHSCDWSEGSMFPPAERYDNMLKFAYESARHSICATSIFDYMETWDGPLGDTLLKIHETGVAAVKRVFIIDRQSDITPRFINILKQQKATKNVEARVFLVYENPKTKFPVELSKDFTIVDDGRMLGITHSYGLGSLRARWTFTANPVQSVCMNKLKDFFRESLFLRSISAEEFLSRYENKPIG